MPTATKRKRKAPDVHPDQMDELIRACELPCQLQPRAGCQSQQERRASVTAQTKLLWAVAGELRDAQNAMIREWLGHHYLLKTGERFTLGEPGLEACPSSVFLAMYHAAKPLTPTTAGDTLTCALNFVVLTIKSQLSPRTNFKRWQAVLIGRKAERPWHWDEPQPIRLSPATANFEQVGGQLHLLAKVVRGEEAVRFAIKGEVGLTRPGGPGSNGQKYNVRLRTLRETLRVKGALLICRYGEWHLTFLDAKAAPRLPVVAEPRRMFVRTSYKAGWKVTWPGNRAFVLGAAELADLAVARRTQIARRAEFKARGLDPRTKEVQAANNYWTNYTTTLAQQSAHDIAELAKAEGIEELCVKVGDEWCALGTVGNEEQEKSEPTRFPFARFATFLTQKCYERGIAVVSRPNSRSYKRRKELWERKLARDELQAVAK